MVCNNGGGHEIKILLKKFQRGTVWGINGISGTLLSSDYKGPGKILIEQEGEKRIRKLTPKEYFRLQGFPDEYFEKARAVNSDTQLYKQAGNGVTVPVIYEIAKRL